MKLIEKKVKELITENQLLKDRGGFLHTIHFERINLIDSFWLVHSQIEHASSAIYTAVVKSAEKGEILPKFEIIRNVSDNSTEFLFQLPNEPESVWNSIFIRVFDQQKDETEDN